jgi:truncated hemoglobin YjbI
MRDLKLAAMHGRIGGLRLAARSDPHAMTQPARDAWLATFERQADPDGILTPAERSRRAALLRRARMTELSIRGRRARQQAAKRHRPNSASTP